MKLQKAITIIENALISYCETDIASDKKAKNLTNEAWQKVLKEVGFEGVDIR